MDDSPNHAGTSRSDRSSVALAHHWVMSYRGGERVFEQMAKLFPGSDWYTLVRDREIEVPGLSGREAITSVLDRLPSVNKFYKHLLPFHPWAISQMRIPGDIKLLLSSDASLIKGINKSDSTIHVCYCHSPPRYLWELGAEYKRSSLSARLLLDKFSKRLRDYDRSASKNVDHFIANSNFVAQRISAYYGRESVVIYPPVAVQEFVSNRKREPFHLVVSELTSYKRIDLAIDAYNKTGKKLIVIGDGTERAALQANAKSNIEFIGRQPFEVLKAHYETCEAFVFPGIEDFGITPVEAQAAGAPVIAFRGGGALETVSEGKTGLFFDSQDSDCLADAVSSFRPDDFEATACRRNSENFSESNFRIKYLGFLSGVAGNVLASESQTKRAG